VLVSGMYRHARDVGRSPGRVRTEGAAVSYLGDFLGAVHVAGFEAFERVGLGEVFAGDLHELVFRHLVPPAPREEGKARGCGARGADDTGAEVGGSGCEVAHTQVKRGRTTEGKTPGPGAGAARG